MDNSTTRWIVIMLAVSMMLIFFLPQINQCNANNAQQEAIDKAIEESTPEITNETYKDADLLYEATGLRLNPPKGVGSATYSSIMVEGENPVAMAAFNTDALTCTYIQQKTDDFVNLTETLEKDLDISEPEQADINGVTWSCTVVDDKGAALRYDTDAKIMYCVYMEGPDLTMRKLQAIVGAL